MSQEETAITLPFGGGTSPALSPQTGLRATFYLDPQFAIEPVTTFAYWKEGDTDLTSWTLALKAVYHFQDNLTEGRFYGALGGTFGLLNVSSTDTQFGLTGELGYKVPMTDYFGLRIAAGWRAVPVGIKFY